MVNFCKPNTKNNTIFFIFYVYFMFLGVPFGINLFLEQKFVGSKYSSQKDFVHVIKVTDALKLVFDYKINKFSEN